MDEVDAQKRPVRQTHVIRIFENRTRIDNRVLILVDRITHNELFIVAQH